MLAEVGKLRAWGLAAGAGLAAAGFLLTWRVRRGAEAGAGGGAGGGAGVGGGAGGRWEEGALPRSDARPVGAEELPGPGSRPRPRPREEVLDYLDSIHGCLESLRAEVRALRECVQAAADRPGGGGGRSTRRTRRRGPRDSDGGDDSADSASIYFAASAGKAASDSGSEAGYATARTETEVEEADTELDTESPQEAMSELELELNSLLQEADRLHQGSHEDKKEGFNALRDNKTKFGNSEEFCWRMIRAFSDMFEITEDEEAQKSYALAGRDEAAVSLQDHGDSAECHKWLAVVSSYLQGQDTGDKRAECAGKLHKERILKPTDLQPDSPEGSAALEEWRYSDKQLQEEESVLVGVIKTYESMCSNQCNATTAENFPVTATATAARGQQKQGDVDEVTASHS
ncbi:regulator of microtubule dynamics protein 3-like [Callorhinchus milii]|uniref:regulator of microtubule dynamics protein 3-like n=1 Tax=Callorhinchus milii TaxID=7868 RepID=UPI001C3F81A7|nr:regulator of microtubule dynamics protein 3-like [Callorhinchus milii]